MQLLALILMKMFYNIYRFYAFEPVSQIFTSVKNLLSA